MESEILSVRNYCDVVGTRSLKRVEELDESAVGQELLPVVGTRSSMRVQLVRNYCLLLVQGAP